MRKYFWREKNADSQIGKYKIIVPTNEQLFDELIKKMYEKVEMIDVIFDKEKRQQYLQKKGKDIDDNIPEIVVQQKIATRVIVDFMQLIIDICLLKKLKIKKLKNKIEKDKIKNDILEALSKVKNDAENSISQIYIANLCLAKTLSLNLDELEIERQKIEDKEGTFYKGKFVIID